MYANKFRDAIRLLAIHTSVGGAQPQTVGAVTWVSAFSVYLYVGTRLCSRYRYICR